MTIVVLDPGHGGKIKTGGSSANNAIGPTGLLEKSVTLDLAKRAGLLLEKAGYKTKLTRTGDVNLGLSDRAAVAKALNAPVFVSLHLNGFNQKAQGTETLLDVLHSPASLRLAQAVQTRVLAATGLKDRGVKAQPLGVLKPTGHSKATACCLVEISFMDVAEEEARLRTDAYKDRIAQALAKGIADYLAPLALEALEAPEPRRRFEDGFALFSAQDNGTEGAPARRAKGKTKNVRIGSQRKLTFDPFALRPDDEEGALETVSAPPAVPPEAAAGDIKVVGKDVFGPGGLKFGRLHKLGLYQIGKTGLSAFFAQDPEAFPELSAGIRNVMRAVSPNEGNIEAINTYDNAYLSAGLYQWTAGTLGDPGELAHLLNVLKLASPATFQIFFGQYGLDVDAPKPVPGKLLTGYLTHDGGKLDTPKRKAMLRQPLWAYRFWRAAHHRDVRRAQVSLAIDRIDTFFHRPIAALGKRPLSAYVTSQLGLAHLLDQHVNRPGHVPGTFTRGVQAFLEEGGPADPAHWSTRHEQAVLALYLGFRHQTTMTDSVKRAERIAARVKIGELSDQRGSL